MGYLYYEVVLSQNLFFACMRCKQRYDQMLQNKGFSLANLKLHSLTMGFLSVIAWNLDAILGPGVMLLYPLYSSMRAIESPSTVDDQQWLTYWVIHSLLTLFELSCWKVLQWLPIWGYMKLILCMWLVLPVFNGAAYIYENYARKYIKFGNFVPSNYPQNQRKVLQMMSLDARKSVERYIEEYGPEAFDRVVQAAEQEARRRM